MWESPVNIMEQTMDSFVAEIQRQEEETILKAVKTIGVVVDKEELMKALQYDRNQYDKGYSDGYADGIAADKWIPISDRLPDEYKPVLFCTKDKEVSQGIRIIMYGHNRYNLTGINKIYWDAEVVAWMPLPDVWEGGTE